LKMIVAMRGRSAAEAVVVCTAETIRQNELRWRVYARPTSGFVGVSGPSARPSTTDRSGG
jgi:hypothetical protein